MHRLLALLGLAVALVASLPDEVQAQARIALLIGNQKYNDRVGPLRNPHNDVALVGRALKEVGFEILDPVKDASRDEMLEAVHDFGTRLRRAGRGAVGFLYYTGHGVSAAGENVLVPANAPDTTDRTLAVPGVKLGDILDTLNRVAPESVFFIVIDACRNSLRGQRGTKGFVPVNDQRTGMVLAFATAAGDTASDEGQVSGPYAEALAAELVKPGQTDQQIFNSVRAEVVRKTRTQIPWTHDGLIGERVVFKPADVTPPPATVQIPVHVPVPARPPAPNQQPPAYGGTLSEAAVAWERIQQTQSLAVLEAFIRQFPGTVYAAEAQERIAELRKPTDDQSRREPASAAGAGTGRSFKDCPQCPELVVVPAGRFFMGSPDNEAQRTAAEGPRRSVSVNQPFAIGKFEVTKGQFAAFAAATGHNVSSGCFFHISPE